MRRGILGIVAFVYQHVLKWVFFRIDSAVIHMRMIKNGEMLGKYQITRTMLSTVFEQKNDMLSQSIHNITFSNPIGLAAGFDHEAHLIKVMPSMGFGFETVGTITNQAYGGNPPPIMGRLPKSQSLMVNKGFKSSGADKIILRLVGQQFRIPIGVSIGRSNVRSLTNEKESISDIINAFQKFERVRVANAYYELNISCPNLFGNISFYPPKHLEALLKEIDSLRLAKPIFIKMPIGETNEAVLAMLDVITNHTVSGIIVGNLQKNRRDPSLDQEEVKRFPVGNFSGKPTWKRSNELITLAYKHFGKKLTIIGCGGVFSAEDAYEKILLGSALVQLITGMIYKGPQLIAQINNELPDLLRHDGFKHISDAIGKKSLLD